MNDRHPKWSMLDLLAIGAMGLLGLAVLLGCIGSVLAVFAWIIRAGFTVLALVLVLGCSSPPPVYTDRSLIPVDPCPACGRLEDREHLVGCWTRGGR